MSKFSIGVMAESFRLPVKEGIARAKELGANGVQVHAVAGETAPENMNAAARGEFRAFVEDLGLEISALCGDLGGHGFQLADENPAKIERSKLIVQLAADLQTSVVTTHIGVIPEDNTGETYANMLGACKELGSAAADAGVTFAIETGPEPATRLKAFIDDVGSGGIGVNMDPANLIMVLGEDPVEAVETLAGHIVHTHAKDGVQLAPCDPVQVYHSFAVGGIEGLEIGKLFNEVPLGQGKVAWPDYLAALQHTGFDGYLTIEREVGDDPAADIALAVEFLEKHI